MNPLFMVTAALLLARPAALPAQAPDTIIRHDVLAPDIHLFRAPSDLDRWTSSNVLVIVGDDDVTVFDTNTRPGVNARVIAEIRRLTNKPVRTLINSHWHQDHWSGNDQYARAWPGLRIIATTEQRDYMRRMSSAYFAATLDSTGEFFREVSTLPRRLPDMAFRDTLVFWSGRREIRLMRATGDATGSAVLYLPAERLLATGDVLVRQEGNTGTPPWTTNSNAIAPWLVSLRAFQALDPAIIVPGQGAALRDRGYLDLVTELYAALMAQVDAALSRGLVRLPDVQAVINVDELVRRFPGGEPTAESYRRWQNTLVRKIYLEMLDGAGRGV